MFEAGALVLLPFPFSDATATKRRPVLVLTTPDEYGDFIGMAVSSRSHHANAVPLQNVLCWKDISPNQAGSGLIE
jgi:mRNA interferase MazF